MKLSIKFLLLSGLLSLPVFGSSTLDIKLKNGSENEILRKEQLLKVLTKYNTNKWQFTDKITIDEKTRIPHSHPRLTLTTFGLNYDLTLLASYLHEQIHWFEDNHSEQTMSVIAKLKLLYPKVPTSPPEGARDEHSTYLHLIVCLLELDALSELIGKEKAIKVTSKNSEYFYKWIYRTVLSDATKIRSVLNDNNLYIR